MNKLNTSIYKYLVLVPMILVQSCKVDQLDDFTIKNGISASVSIKGQSGQIKKDAENIRVPIEVQLSNSAAKAFDAHISLAEDAVLSAIAGNILTNTLSMPRSAIVIPETVTIPFGSNSIVFDALIDKVALEKFYFSGKKVAFAIKLTAAAKGNTIDEKKSIGIIPLDPSEIFTVNEMHILSITNGGGSKLEVSGTSNYIPSVASIDIPLGISLSGTPSRSFTVDVAINNDTVSVLKSNGIVPLNAVVMQVGEFDLVSQVTVNQVESAGKLNLTIPLQTLLKYKNDKIVLVVQLKSSSRHVIHPVNRTVILLIDPASIIIANSYAAWFPLHHISQFNLLNKNFNS